MISGGFERYPTPFRAFLVGLIGLLLVGRAAAIDSGPVSEGKQGASAWGRLLDRHVGVGRIDGIRLHVVDYEALATDPDYQAALENLATARPESLASDDARIAFWINALSLIHI